MKHTVTTLVSAPCKTYSISTGYFTGGAYKVGYGIIIQTFQILTKRYARDKISSSGRAEPNIRAVRLLALSFGAEVGFSGNLWIVMTCNSLRRKVKRDQENIFKQNTKASLDCDEKTWRPSFEPATSNEADKNLSQSERREFENDDREVII